MSTNPPTFDATIARVRAHLGVEERFSDAALDEARSVAAERPAEWAPYGQSRTDLSDVPFATIDPSGSRDLDQAFSASATDSGFVVRYAIADVAHWVDRGGAVETAAWVRGETLYAPDRATPLYPPEIGSDAASLLENQDRPAIVFSFELDRRGAARLVDVARAIVRSRKQLAYEDVSAHLAAERERAGSGPFAGAEWSESLALLETIGRLRQTLADERGAVSLPISAQHVLPWEAAASGYLLAFRDPNDVEGWNAEISLMTGMAAGELMAGAGVGLLRALDPPRREKVVALRLTAAALGVAWPADVDYAAFIRSLDPTDPRQAAVVYHAAGAMGGARYVALVGDDDGAGDRDADERDDAKRGRDAKVVRHAAIASVYAHVTAPIRRLADRYALDCVVELWRGARPSDEDRETLGRLPAAMAQADRRASQLESAIVDMAEASALADRAGETFDALVIRLRPDRVTVQITDPPVRVDLPNTSFASSAVAGARGEGELPVRLSDDGAALVAGGSVVRLGDRLRVRLESIDTNAGRLMFVPVA